MLSPKFSKNCVLKSEECNGRRSSITDAIIIPPCPMHVVPGAHTRALRLNYCMAKLVQKTKAFSLRLTVAGLYDAIAKRNQQITKQGQSEIP